MSVIKSRLWTSMGLARRVRAQENCACALLLVLPAWHLCHFSDAAWRAGPAGQWSISVPRVRALASEFQWQRLWGCCSAALLPRFLGSACGPVGFYARRWASCSVQTWFSSGLWAPSCCQFWLLGPHLQNWRRVFPSKLLKRFRSLFYSDHSSSPNLNTRVPFCMSSK